MNDRVELKPDEVEGGVYPWLTASLIPRAIAWVSSVSADGVENIAPHSFTTVAGIEPPTLCFVSVGSKDTLANVRATGEFVLCIGTWDQLHDMNDTATDFPGHLSEFEQAGLEREPSAVVAAPRLAHAPVVFECRAAGEYVIGDCTMVFGEIVHLAARRSVLAPDGLPDARALDPLARLGRAEWSRIGETYAIPRIRWQTWQDGRRSADGAPPHD